MLLICTACALGGGYVLIRCRAVPPFPVAGMFLLSLLLLGLWWIGDQSGFFNLLEESWQFLSGNKALLGGRGCNPDNGFLLDLVLLVFVLASLVPLGLAALGTPFGIIVTTFGALKALFSDDSDSFASGLALLASGVASVVVAGLMWRLVNIIEGC